MGIVNGGEGYPLNRKEFGIHSLSAVSRTTGLPYGEAAIVGDASVEFSASSVDLRGGSSLYPRATEITEIDSMVNVNIRTFPDWIFELYMAGSISTTVASATDGTIGTITNIVGTTVVSAAGVIDPTLKVGGEDDLKTNYYIVVAVSATTVDVYTVSDFQFSRGVDLFLDSDTLKITTAPLTIVLATAVEIPGTGIELTGGAGAIAMDVGDVGMFQVAPPHNGISDIDIGTPGGVFPEHELYIFGKERASGETALIRCFKAQCVSGLTYNFSQSDFSTTDISIKLLLDESAGKVATFRFTDGIIA